MAGSKSSNIILSMLSYAAATLMFVSILNVVPKAQAHEEAAAAKCPSFLADVPGGKAYCNELLKPSNSPPPSNGQRGQDLGQCFVALKPIEGCVGSIFYALSHNDFSKITRACCGAIEVIAFECLAQLFPWAPMFPVKLVSFCKTN